jgi:Ca-activated chloride channel family protein
MLILGTEEVRCPLLRVDAKVELVAEMAQVELTQVYRNETEKPLEAMYRMPLPADAAVTRFTATLGDRTVVGVVEEKEKAVAAYRKAIKKGDSAFLLSGTGGDVFDVAVGNLAPGETCEIAIRYIQTVPWTDGEYRFLLPTVLAPRYNPDGCAVDNQPFLGEADYRLHLDATIRGAGEVLKVKSPSHAIRPMFDDGACRVELKSESFLDSDLVLLYRVAAEDRRAVRVSGETGSFVYARFSVGEDVGPTGAVPREYSFVVDTSGSMSGQKLEQAVRAVSLCLRSLVKGDTFEIVAFGSTHVNLFGTPEAYNSKTLAKAERFLANIPELGGTEILAPLKELFTRSGKGGLERMVYLFTDGQVGNESQVIDLVRKNARGMRFFPFGIDTAVNKAFIDGLAEAGGGLPEYIYPGEAIEDKVMRQFARAATPCVEDLRLETVSGGTAEAFPQANVVGFPKVLFAGESATVVLRMPEGLLPERLLLKGTLDGGPFCTDLELVPVEDGGTVARWWARGRIREMEQRNAPEDRKGIVALSTKFGVLSDSTAFVMSLERADPVTGKRIKVRVPSALPSAWEEESLPMMFMKSISHSPAFSLGACRSGILSDVSFSSCREDIYEDITDDSDIRMSFSAPMPCYETSERVPDMALMTAVLLMGADGSVLGDADKTAWLALAMLFAKDMKKFRGQLRKCLAWLAAQSVRSLAVKAALWVGVEKGIGKADGIVAETDEERTLFQAIQQMDGDAIAHCLGIPDSGEENWSERLAMAVRG